MAKIEVKDPKKQPKITPVKEESVKEVPKETKEVPKETKEVEKTKKKEDDN